MNPLTIKAAETIAGGVLAGLDNLFTSDDEREAAKLKMVNALQAPLLGQLEVNKAEAANPNLFTSGWRPSIGWVGAAALAYNYIGHPLLLWAGRVWFPEIEPPPSLDTGELFALITGMLGLAGVRSFDLVKRTRK